MLGSSKAAPDAWNDDWETLADQQEKPGIEEKAQKASSNGVKPMLLSRPSNPDANASTRNVDDLAPHMQNLRIWNEANTTSAFEVVAGTSQPVKTVYKPELKILKRSSSNSPSATDKSGQNSRTSTKANGEGEGGEILRETFQEKSERLRKEREARYNRVREQIFKDAPDLGNGNADKLTPGTKSGKNSGTSTPTNGAKGPSNASQRQTPVRKTSPSNRQGKKRDNKDDDFVPRSAMIAGTYESYQMDQQLQAQARVREQGQTYPGYPPFDYSNNTNHPGYGHHTSAVNYPQMGQANPGANMAFITRTLPSQQSIKSTSWDTYNTQVPQPYQHPHPAPPQFSPPPPHHFANPYGYYPNTLPQYPGQSGQEIAQQASSQQPHHQLYDPLYASGPLPNHLQFQQQPNTYTQTPIREPRMPDGSGRGGYGFAGRGGGNVGGVAPPHHDHHAHQNSKETSGSGFNSAAAAAPWGASALSTQEVRNSQIWSGQSPGNPSVQHQQGSGQSQNLPVPSLGNGVWSGSTTWQRNNP